MQELSGNASDASETLLNSLIIMKQIVSYLVPGKDETKIIEECNIKIHFHGFIFIVVRSLEDRISIKSVPESTKIIH